MELYFLRHGIAEDASSTGRDSDRRLTDEGRRKLRQILQRVGEAGVSPDLMLTSPYVRARQTAEIAKEILGYKEDLVVSDALRSDSDPQAVWQEIRSLHGGAHRIVLASHEPLMSRCTGYFLNAPELIVDFKKGAVVRIDVDQAGVHPRGVLRWMLVPKLAGA